MVNLKELRKGKNLSLVQIAEKLDVSKSHYARIENGESTLSIEYAKKLSEIYGINYLEIFLKDEDYENAKSHFSGNARLLDNDGFYKIKYFNVKACAGHGHLNACEHFTFEAVPKTMIDQNHCSSIENVVMIDVVGESMQPTLSNADIVMLDTGIDRVEEGKIYAIEIGGELSIKRLRHDTINKKIVVMCDNKMFESWEADADQVA